MSADSEAVVGIVPANARLGIGFEELLLVVTNKRVIVAHQGKKGRTGLASTMILGGHSGDFVDPDKPKKLGGGGRGFENVDPAKVLASNKDNFALGFSEIVSVTVDQGRDSTSVAVITGDDKFQFYARLWPSEVSETLMQALGDRLVTRRLTQRSSKPI